MLKSHDRDILQLSYSISWFFVRFVLFGFFFARVAEMMKYKHLITVLKWIFQ